jgi:leader peptidase (prepilin peptidase) / N-methyltransferase
LLAPGPPLQPEAMTALPSALPTALLHRPTGTALLAAPGLLAGAGARLLLRRLRRGARVPPPWCELAVALAWGAVGAAAGVGVVPVLWLPVLLGLGWLAVAAGAVDLRHHRLPDALTLPALPLALLLLAPLGPEVVLRAGVGAVLAFAAYAAVHLAAPAALGAGDVKLAAPLGAVLAGVSWEALVVGGVLAAIVSGAAAVVLLVVRGRRGVLPHGPSMLLAGLLVAAAGARGP